MLVRIVDTPTVLINGVWRDAIPVAQVAVPGTKALNLAGSWVDVIPVTVVPGAWSVGDIDVHPVRIVAPGTVGAFYHPVDGLAPLVALNSVGALYGDSNIANSLQTVGNAVVQNAKGVVTWGALLNKNRLRVPLGANKAVVGRLTSTMAQPAELSALLAIPNLKVVVMNGGTNDLASRTSAAIIGSLKIIFDTITAANVYVVYVTIYPRFAPNALSPADEIKRQEVNAWALAYALDKLRVVATDGLTADWNAWLSDGLHTNTRGAYGVGVPVGAVLDGILSEGDTLSLISGNLLTNPTLAGNTGSKSGGATGEVAANWDLINSSGGGAVVGSKLPGGAQRVVVSGAATGGGRSVVLKQYTPTGAVVAGNQYEAFVDFTLNAPLQNATINIGTIIWNASSAILASSQELFLDNADIEEESWLPAGRYVLRAPIKDVPSGVPNGVELRVNILFKNGAALPIAADFTVALASIQKVT